MTTRMEYGENEAEKTTDGAADAERKPSAGQHGWGSIPYRHVPHPHIENRKKHAPKRPDHAHRAPGPIVRFNNFLGEKITEGVGTMWCAYIFAALALVSLPEAIKGGVAPLVAWTAQTFIQLVLLSIIMVGQKIAGVATDRRAIDTYNDAEAVLHEAIQIQEHLAAQDAFLQKLIEELVDRKVSQDPGNEAVTQQRDAGK